MDSMLRTSINEILNLLCFRLLQIDLLCLSLLVWNFLENLIKLTFITLIQGSSTQLFKVFYKFIIYFSPFLFFFAISLQFEAFLIFTIFAIFSVFFFSDINEWDQYSFSAVFLLFFQVFLLWHFSRVYFFESLNKVLQIKFIRSWYHQVHS